MLARRWLLILHQTYVNKFVSGPKGGVSIAVLLEQLTGYALEIDHIIPQAQAGLSTPDNLCLACRRCNAHKSYQIKAINPHTQQLVTLFNPRRQVWSEHFQWSENGTYIIGKTPQGQATIAKLRMNDPLIVRTRALMGHSGVASA